MKGDMKVEVLRDTSEADSLAKAKRRQALILKTPGEVETCHFDPEGARDQVRPGYMMEEY